LFVFSFPYWRMADPNPMPDPESPEWNVGWTIKRALRLHLGPRHGYLPWMIARDVVAALKGRRQLSGELVGAILSVIFCRFTTPPRSRYPTGAGALQ
jgi:hypothetical protein